MAASVQLDQVGLFAKGERILGVMFFFSWPSYHETSISSSPNPCSLNHFPSVGTLSSQQIHPESTKFIFIAEWASVHRPQDNVACNQLRGRYEIVLI